MSTAGPALLPIEIAIAHRDRQRLIRLEVTAGTTVGEALDLAEPELGEATPGPQAAIGIFGVIVSRARELAAGDRIELYRELPADPKETRRRLAREGRTMGRAR